MAGYRSGVLLLVALLTIVLTAEGRSCNFPPSLWCSSDEIAAACQVVRQCQEYWKATEMEISVEDRTRTKSVAALVEFTLYYETLCPDCQNFYKKQLLPAYKTVGSIVNITLVPYGNAHESKSSSGKWQFQCQHGVQECIGNLIDTCTINIVKNFTVYFPFINCMEEKLYEGDVKPPEAAVKCAKKFDLKELDSILACSQSEAGIEMEHQMALKTGVLKPPHTFVPWVTLNGVHNDKIQTAAENNLTDLICDTYTGPKPPACQETLKYRQKV